MVRLKKLELYLWWLDLLDLAEDFWAWLEDFSNWPDWERAVTLWWWTLCALAGAFTFWHLAKVVSHFLG